MSNMEGHTAPDWHDSANIAEYQQRIADLEAERDVYRERAEIAEASILFRRPPEGETE